MRLRQLAEFIRAAAVWPVADHAEALAVADELLDRVLEEYQARLAALPSDALDPRSGSPQPESLRKLRGLVMFATQAAALKEKAVAALELKRRATMLEETNARLDGVLSALSSGVMIFDATGACLKANDAARQLAGTNNDTALARLIESGVPQDGVAEPQAVVGPLDDRIGHAQVCGDQIGPERGVLAGLDVTDDALDVDEAGRGRPPARLVDGVGIAVDRHDLTRVRRQRQRHPPGARAHVEDGQLAERLGGDQRPERRADAGRRRAHGQG
jgi:PAS domain-containing protein